MSDLSPDARALLRRAAPADEPTEADRARVLGMITGVGVVAGAGSAAAAGGSLKLVIAFVVSVGVGGLATTAATRSLRPAPVTRAPAVAVAVPRAPPVAVAPAPAAIVEEEAPAAEGGPVPLPPPPTRPVAKPAPAPAVVPEGTPDVAIAPAPVPRPVVRDDTCELPAELGVVQRAQQALGASPAQAVTALDAFADRCPSGVLVEERLATRALGLCLAGRRADGRAAAQELAERFPASPSLPRVTQACAE